GAELRSAARLCAWIAALIQDEVPHPASQRVSDSDALLEARIIDIVRFRVEDVDQVFIIGREGNTARHSELVPCGDVLSVLVEDLDPGIAPIACEQAASLVHGDAVHRAEFTRRIPGLSPGLDELSVFRI